MCVYVSQESHDPQENNRNVSSDNVGIDDDRM